MGNNGLTERLKEHSLSLERKGLRRLRQVMGASPFASNFSSNDYLSLTSYRPIQKAYQDAFARFPVGSGGSMVVSGYHRAHQAIEQAFAQALGVDDCLLFSSGYAANLSVMGLLSRFNTHAVIDKGVHASFYDGIALSHTRYVRYRHQDIADLSIKLKELPNQAVVVTEGIFSMSGQRSSLADIATLCRQHKNDLWVDEAHAFGVVGQEGLGAVIDHGLTQQEVPLRIIPLGKAFAGSGAIVAGQREWIDALLQSARPYIYSTAISPAVAHAFLATLEVVRAADDRRKKLNDLVLYFRDKVARSPLQWRDSSTPIQQLQLGCPHRALQCEVALQQKSIVCLPMRQPTVSRRETGLRVILNHHHEYEVIDQLFDELHRL